MAKTSLRQNVSETGRADLGGVAVGQRAPSVELRSVTKSYGDSVALHPLDLDIRDGEFLSLLGPSGCGKTTTLKIIAGFETPTSGSVVIGGENASRLPPHKRDVNTVFQNYALFPHMSVRDNVAYGLKQRGVDRADRRRRAMEALEMVALAHRADSRPTAMSGGQQQRVALARALVLRPKVLLLDEPLGALDLKLRQHMQIELKRIHREVGITFVFVTHDQGEALSMSDRIAVMNAGRLEQLATPQEVYDRPASRFVAGFMGEMNQVDGILQPDGAVTVSPGLTVSPELTVESAPVGSLVTVGIRPRDVLVGVDGPSHAVVTDVMTIGHEVQIVMKLDAGPEIIAVDNRYLAASVGSEHVPGSRVSISAVPGSSLLLGASTATTLSIAQSTNTKDAS